MNIYVNIAQAPLISAFTEFQEADITEWWPNGYGNQTLYQVYVYFESNISQEISSKKIKIGFRTVELNQDYVTQNKSQGELNFHWVYIHHFGLMLCCCQSYVKY